MSFYLYQTTNLVNGNYYVGMHVGELKDTYLGSGKLLKQAIHKYGKDNFKKEILVVCETIEELRRWEKRVVGLRIEDPKCYNLAPGGQGGDLIKHFDENEKRVIREKAGKAIKEYNKLNPEKVLERQERQKKTLLKNLENLKTNIRKSLASRSREEVEEQHRKVTESKLKRGYYSVFQLISPEGEIVMESIGAEQIAAKYGVSANGIRLASKHKKPITRGNLQGYRVIKQTKNQIFNYDKN